MQMKSIKILHIYKCFDLEPKGGIEQYIKHFSASTYNFNVRNTLLFLGDKNYELDLGYLKLFSEKKLFEISSNTFGSISFFIKFIELQKKNDIIVFHYPWPFGDLVTIFNIVSKPYLIFYQADIIKQKNLEKIYKPIRYFFFKNSKRIIVTSTNYMTSSKVLLKWKHKIDVIPIHLNEKLIEEKINLGKKSIIDDGYFLFIGKNRHYKGIELLEKVFLRLPSIKLKIISNINKDNTDNVEYLTDINDENKYAYIRNSMAIILPSTHRSESFGISLLEGLFFGKPLISTELGSGTSFVNLNNVTGIVIKPNSEKELYNAIIKIHEDEDLRVTFSKNALDRYKKIFDEKNLIHKIMSIITTYI